ncbi:MAG: homoserine kinase [Microbacteriaceae bacterium]|nr:homoserine kinase [Microbacteriaceae bacterium]
MTEKFRAVFVQVPATTANLGPGFDTLGLALSLYDEIQVFPTDDGKYSAEITGSGAGEVETDENNLVIKSILYVFDKVGVKAPGLRLVANNRIPHGRGLGSSGAAIVSGVVAARGILSGITEISDEQLLGYATELEGHPDNIAPALFGGLTIAWVTDNGPKFKKLLPHRLITPIVLVPEQTMSTKLARSLQPESVPHQDAIFNVSRSVLLMAALVQSPELLLEGTEDKLHQNYRASAMPETSELIKQLREQGFAAVVSGAGPSVLVLCSDPSERVAVQDFVKDFGDRSWKALMLTVDIQGARLELLDQAT